MNFKNCYCHAGKKSQAEISIFNGLLRVFTFFSLISIGIYRSVFTAHFGAGVCRFEPSCSAYANQAFLEFPFFKALKLTCIRLYKCRPGSSFGYDPLPSSDSTACPIGEIP